MGNQITEVKIQGLMMVLLSRIKRRSTTRIRATLITSIYHYPPKKSRLQMTIHPPLLKARVPSPAIRQPSYTKLV